MPNLRASSAASTSSRRWSPRRSSSLDHPAGDPLHRFGVELDACGCHRLERPRGGRDASQHPSRSELMFAIHNVSGVVVGVGDHFWNDEV